MTWLYRQTESAAEGPPFGLFTVGHYNPRGEWEPESDHNKAEEAASRVSMLNGSERYNPEVESLEARVSALEDGLGALADMHVHSVEVQKSVSEIMWEAIKLAWRGGRKV